MSVDERELLGPHSLRSCRKRPAAITWTETRTDLLGQRSCLYFYLMKEAPERVKATAPADAAYCSNWVKCYAGRAFADRSGGLITFYADSGREADRLSANDPFRSRTHRGVMAQGVGPG